MCCWQAGWHRDRVLTALGIQRSCDYSVLKALHGPDSVCQSLWVTLILPWEEGDMIHPSDLLVLTPSVPAASVNPSNSP